MMVNVFEIYNNLQKKDSQRTESTTIGTIMSTLF